MISLFLMFLSFFFFFLFLRERQSASGGGGQRERETQNVKQVPGSELSAQSLMAGVEPTNREIMT